MKPRLSAALVAAASFAFLGHAEEDWELPPEAALEREEYLERRLNGLLGLNRTYVAKLNEILKEYTRAGDLEPVIAVKKEIKRVEAEIAALQEGPQFSREADSLDPGRNVEEPEKPTLVTIDASAERGTVIEGLAEGDRLALRYRSGKWKSHGVHASENPDSVVTNHADDNRLGVFGRKVGATRPIRLAMVPPQTVDRKFELTIPPGYREIFLRVNEDPDGEWESNPGSVVYEVEISKARP